MLAGHPVDITSMVSFTSQIGLQHHHHISLRLQLSGIIIKYNLRAFSALMLLAG